MKISTNNVRYPFISFEIKGLNLSWDNNKPNYFDSLSHVRYIDKANTATVKILYLPPYGEDPNKVEQALSESAGLCKFQYGVAGYKSYVYQGQVYDYSTNFSNGYLEYTLSIISAAATYNFTTITDNTVSIKSPEDIDFYQDISDKAQAVSRDTSGDTNDNQQRTNYVLDIMELIVSQYCGDNYVFDRQNSAIGFTINHAVSTQGMSPFKALKTIASNLTDITSDSEYFYHIVIDDSSKSDGKGRVYLVRKGKTGSIGASFSFDWNSKDSDVLSWSPQYSGTAAIFTNKKNLLRQDSTENNNQSYQKISTIDINNGETSIKTVDYPSATAHDSAASNEAFWQSAWNSKSLIASAAESIQAFNEAVNYAYKASITVLGLSDKEVDLVDTYIEVKPYINGQLHHSAGVYQVIGITDNINSQGFTTTLDLVKYVGSTTA